MKSKKLMLYTAIALCVITLGFVLNTVAQPQSAQLPARQTGGGISLQPPAFFKAAYAQDAEQPVCTPELLSNAGVMVYVDLQTELDVYSLSSFDFVEEQTDQYIKGSFLPPGFETVPEYDEAAYVQVLVCSDGWIVAYLPKEQFAAALLDWANYDQRKLQKTPLEDAINKVTKELGLSLSSFAITYYDARYPNATGIKLVANSIKKTQDATTHIKDFQIFIPKKLMVYEFSWSHALLDMTPAYIAKSECKVNETLFNSLTSQAPGLWGRLVKAFDNTETMLGKTQNFGLVQNDGASSYCGVAIVYGEAAQ